VTRVAPRWPVLVSFIIGGLAATSMARSMPSIPFPGPDRADLALPAGVWDRIRDRVAATDRPIGYDADEMRQYGRSDLLLDTTLRRFHDVRALPRFTGRLTDQLLADADRAAAFGVGWSEGGLGELARRSFHLLDTSTARRTMPDTLDVDTDPFEVPPAVRDRWLALAPHHRELVRALYRAALDVRPWVRAAYDDALLARIAGDREVDALTSAELHRIAMAHRTDEAAGQLATLDRRGFELLASVDLAYLGYASVRWLRHVERALARHREASASTASAGRGDAASESIRFTTPLGDVLVGGTGDDTHTRPAFLTLELDGDDEYIEGFGTPARLGSPVAILVDLGGDDVHTPDPVDPAEASPRPGSAAGIFGLGAVIDLDGHDTYRAGESALGRGCFGAGFLIDVAGDDTYDGEGRWTQGAAHAGIGVLLDLAGNDRYSCASQSQGLGATLGVGLLLDRTGHDVYEARDDGNPSELYLGQSVAMSQGCGYGRRADLGDGHSLAGGVGILLDGAGDDHYHAQVWAQGAGYWWGVGILEDRAGHDTYRNGKYSSGAAAHFAIGVHVDLAGDDRYNLDNDTAKNQFQGHARDGSIGLFIDGDGDDAYAFRSHCAGSGDLGSIGLFWDRRGDDRYAFDPSVLDDGDWANTPPLGSTTRYEPFHSFRDDLPVWGLFLDTGGHDEYATGGIGNNDGEWSMSRYPRATGLGVDAAVYEEDAP